MTQVQKTILIVEDERVLAQALQMKLSKEGFTVEIAENGEEALRILTTKSIDFIVMDLLMPVMDGFQATRLIRSFEEKNKVFPKIPILALTANVLDDFKVKCIEAGMDDFLTKPIKRDLVFQAIQHWAGKRK